MLKKLSVVPDEFSAEPENPSDLTRECKSLIEQLAGERQRSDNRERRLHRAADLTGQPYRTIRALYYGEITDPEHPAVKQLRDAAKQHELIDIAERLDALTKRVRRLLPERRHA